MKDERLKPCPFCGKIPTIYVCDGEGNIHDENYQDDPWSGLTYSLYHEYGKDQSNDDICPIATHPNEILGTQLYDSVDELVERWNKRFK